MDYKSEIINLKVWTETTKIHKVDSCVHQMTESVFVSLNEPHAGLQN